MGGEKTREAEEGRSRNPRRGRRNPTSSFLKPNSVPDRLSPEIKRYQVQIIQIFGSYSVWERIGEGKSYRCFAAKTFQAVDRPLFRSERCRKERTRLLITPKMSGVSLSLLSMQKEATGVRLSRSGAEVSIPTESDRGHSWSSNRFPVGPLRKIDNIMYIPFFQ